LGQADYHDLSSPLFHNISALVPSGISNPPSLTQYLGVKDWYTMHYLSNCSGFFAASTTNPSLLTATKINVTCERRGSDYTFALGATLQQDINRSIRALADEAASKAKNFSTGGPVTCLFTGLSTCFATLWSIPSTFSGRRRYVNQKVLAMTAVCPLVFQSFYPPHFIALSSSYSCVQVTLTNPRSPPSCSSSPPP